MNFVQPNTSLYSLFMTLNIRRYKTKILLFLFCIATTHAATAHTPSLNDKNTSLPGYVLHSPDELPQTARVQAIAQSVKEITINKERFSLSGSYQGRTGIDVSRHQGNINWAKVATDEKVSFAYLKVSEGRELVDRTFHTNLKGAKKHGIKVGCYHFFSPTVPPAEQFKNFSANYNPDEQDLIPVLDVETIGRNSSAQLRQKVKVFLNLFEKKYGFKPIIYTYVNFYNKHFVGQFHDYKLMIAQYRDDEPILRDGRDYVLWQYTAKGSVYGITGDVDLNRFHHQTDINDIILKR